MVIGERSGDRCHPFRGIVVSRLAIVKGFVKRQLWPFLCAMALFTIGTIAWAQWSSVIWFAKGELTERSPGLIKMHVTAYKPRECQFIPDSQLGYARTETGAWREVSFSFVDDITPNSTHPRLWFERQSFGVWQWKEGQSTAPIDAVMATVVHNCSGTMAQGSNLSIDLPEQLKGYRLTRIGPLDATGPISK